MRHRSSGGRNGGSRLNAMWGKGGRGLTGSACLAAALCLVLPLAAAAGEGNGKPRAMVAPALAAAVAAHPDATYQVIVEGAGKAAAAHVKKLVAGEGGEVRRTFTSIEGVAAALTGRDVTELAKLPSIRAISADAPVQLSDYSSEQLWPSASGVASLWPSGTPAHALPAIAVIDSGVESARDDFGGRVVHEVTMTSLSSNSAGDGRGHGTFVSALAAGSAPGYAGAAPTANIVSVDVVDDAGMARTSDVIAAADWVLANKDAHNIRVANFSLHSAQENSFMYDPLCRAVERLWLGGIVVVAAAGNYATDGQPSGVPYAPGNDPFVITVGALDVNGTLAASDDFAAPWSAYGHTHDGFAKPELGAPGRYMISAVPMSSTLALERPDRIVSSGYMQLSGTSFAAPVVAGAAAALLGAHPEWTPDQVKGALMLAADQTSAAPGSAGVGALDAAGAMSVENPPNPNLALNQFLVPDPNGGSVPVFDTASWRTTASTDASWESASWESASWESASWESASWESASWESASWESASWESASWESASWESSTVLSNLALGDFRPGGYAMPKVTTPVKVGL